MPKPERIAEGGSRERLMSIIKRLSFSNDRLVHLSSGRESMLYFNMKPTMLDCEGSWHLARELLKVIPTNIRFVGGLEMGAVPLVSSMAPVAFQQKRDLALFFVRKKVKEYGSRQRIEGLGPGKSLAGQEVVVVDDVTTTGESVQSTFEVLQDAGATVSSVVSVVDREEGASELFSRAGVPFQSIFRASDFT